MTVGETRTFASRNDDMNIARSRKVLRAHHPLPRSNAHGHPNTRKSTHSAVRPGARLLALCALLMPPLALAQASPFLTGATALESNILAWLTPVAVILVMVLGAMAMANRISWAWCIAAILGIAIAFGAPQIVTWVRGMFGV
jgi:type IV secretion system protein VirB2